MKKLLFILIMFPIVGTSQSWNQVSNFIEDGRHHPITFANDNYGFVVCGSYTNDVFKYDKLNDSWSQLQDFPAAGRGYSYGVTVGNKAYMGLGSTSNGLYPNDWWEYNMDNDSWTQKSSLPTDGRNHPAMIAINNKIYMGCGSNDNGNLGDWWEYDIINDVWSQKTSIIGNDRHHPFYFGIGNYAYVGFGHGSSPVAGTNPTSYIYNDFYRYDPTNDNWIQLSNFPSEARVAGTQFSYNGKGYILSGDGDNHGPLDSGEFWEYNPSNDSWNQLTSHPGGAIWAPGNFVIGCDVYFLLGQNRNTSPGTYPISVYQYKLSEDCGCIDPTAYNFSNLAISDDGSCCYVSGCTDNSSLNYDSLSCYDDGSCIPSIIGCLNSTASNYNPLANVSTFNGGAFDNSIGSGSYFAGDQHIIFNSNEECIIRSADIYSESINTVTFEIRSSNGTVLDDTTYNITAGKQNIILNFNVPNGNGLQLGLSTSNSGLYRNNTGVNFPYNIGNMLSVTGSSAGVDYYYYYYNIEVEAKCLDITGLSNQFNNKKSLLKVTDILGRETEEKLNTPLFYIYEDGTVKKRIVIE
jgi:N-acetylneuraminic acid mutarotase